MRSLLIFILNMVLVVLLVTEVAEVAAAELQTDRLTRQATTGAEVMAVQALLEHPENPDALSFIILSPERRLRNDA